MKAEVIIENGQARLLKPIYLKPAASKRFEIEIPDEALEVPKDWYPDELSKPVPKSVKPPAQPGSLQEELNGVLGALSRIRLGASIGDDHQMLLEALEERYAGR
jgi:hypothetical protein